MVIDMKKKVGILTLHNNTNYGANLQAFASNKYISNLGYDCNLIDYTYDDRLNHILSWIKLVWQNGKTKSLVHNIKLVISILLAAPTRFIQLKNFKNFRGKYCNMTVSCKDEFEVSRLGFDTVVCGSDQIWNTNITNGIKKAYFGDIYGVKNKIAYAASIGSSRFKYEQEEDIKKLILKMNYVSVREQQSVDYVSEMIEKNIECVCDPVFLLDRSVYDKIAVSVTNKKYALLYSIVPDKNLTDCAVDYAKKNGFELIEICRGKTKGAKHCQKISWSPEKFLGAFKNAEAVFTNSFHGTAFSIIFEKKFFVYDNKAVGGARITGLLDKAGLGSRLLDTGTPMPEGDIDYNTVKNNLKEYVESSKEFLNNALEAKIEPLIQEGCVGCGACAAVCKKSAVSLHQNKEGFYKAYVDSLKCVKCNLCKDVCPGIKEIHKESPKGVFAFKANNDIRKNSASGGAFATLAEKILNDNGIVYGAVLNKDFTVSHIRCDCKEELSLIQGTKYVQSDIRDCFELIKTDLKNRKKVLFSGTPCQVESVKGYAEKSKLDVDNLYLVDIICHGVPSPMIFKDFIGFLEEKFKSKVLEYKFRSKKISWRGNSCYVKLTDGRELKNDRLASGFMSLYYSNCITADNCYNCRFTSVERSSDLTISDYWGIENVNKAFEDKLGVSMILANTEKGERLLEGVNGEITEGSLDGVKQPQLYKSVKAPKNREEFWSDYNKFEMEKLLKKYGGVSGGGIKSRIARIVKR